MNSIARRCTIQRRELGLRAMCFMIELYISTRATVEKEEGTDQEALSLQPAPRGLAP